MNYLTLILVDIFASLFAVRLQCIILLFIFHDPLVVALLLHLISLHPCVQRSIIHLVIIIAMVDSRPVRCHHHYCFVLSMHSQRKYLCFCLWNLHCPTSWFRPSARVKLVSVLTDWFLIFVFSNGWVSSI